MVARRSLFVALTFALATATVAFSACIRTTPRTVKIGVVAPFDGPYREIGADVIPAMRVAIQEWADQAGRNDIHIEIVAYDDMGDPAIARAQAERLIRDNEVAVVVGHWLEETSEVALPVYEEAKIPVVTYLYSEEESSHFVLNLAPSESTLNDAIIRLSQDGADTDALVGDPGYGLYYTYSLREEVRGDYFVLGTALVENISNPYWDDNRQNWFAEEFRENSFGSSPGPWSLVAYEATWVAIELVSGETPLEYIRFDDVGRRVDPPLYLFRWLDGERVFVEEIQPS